jgi:hypothetical protein
MYRRTRISSVCGASAAWVCLFILLWAGSVASAQEPIQLPDTHAGRCAAAFFKAFNSGDDDASRAFEKEFRAESALKKRPIEQRIEQMRGLREQWPRLAATRIVHSEERALTLLVQVIPLEETLEFQFDFEPQPPYGLTGIRIAGPVDPAEFTEPKSPLDAEARSAAIEQIIDILDEGYVFPKVAKKMAEALQGHLAAGKYDDVTSARVFASRVTDDLQAICNDRHLRVTVGGMTRRMERRSDPAESARVNYGFVRVERLPGNIGYVKLNMFHDSTEAQDTAAAALAFLAHCDALIFDLRDNGGGSPEMIKFISSYLFDEPTHLNSFYDRLENQTSETWTTAEIPGKRFAPDLPVYVLTSSRTFSGAEEFTYNLKHLKRATIVGETTGGGAHPVTFRKINDCFSMSVPFARAVNPITKTNWEAVGIVPHIKVSAADALDTARRHATEQITERRASREDAAKEPSG